MEITIAEFVPTLNEYVDVHIKNPDPEIKIKVDDFCDFPGPENCQSKIEKIKKKKRNSLLNSFNKRVDDVIMLNRYALHQYNINAEKIAPLFKNYDEQHGGMFSIIYDEHDETKVDCARMGFINFNYVCELLTAKKIADEGLIIHLWATIEQFVKRAIIIMGGEEKEMPFKWHELKRLSTKNGIDLESLPSYAIINVIRFVYNKIQHLYIVDDELSKYPGFEKYKGKKMSLVDYRTHEYALATYHFMNRLVMFMGPIISYAPDRIID